VPKFPNGTSFTAVDPQFHVTSFGFLVVCGRRDSDGSGKLSCHHEGVGTDPWAQISTPFNALCFVACGLNHSLITWGQLAPRLIGFCGLLALNKMTSLPQSQDQRGS